MSCNKEAQNTQEQKCKIIFFHGWAFDCNFWSALSLLLPDHFHQSLYDAGYFTPNNTSRAIQATHTMPTVGISHSHGINTLLKSNIKFDAIISLNSTISSNKNKIQLKEHAIIRMIKKMQNNPHQVLADFYKRCNLQYKAKPHININKLISELENMISPNPPLPTSIPHIELVSRHDKITPHKLPSTTSKKSLFINNRAGHALGLKDAKWCAKIIEQTIPKIIAKQ